MIGRVLLAALLAGIVAAIDCLRRGGVVALPTDTVYGLAVALPTQGGIERLFEIKRRPPDKGIMLPPAHPAHAPALPAWPAPPPCANWACAC